MAIKQPTDQSDILGEVLAHKLTEYAVMLAVVAVCVLGAYRIIAPVVAHATSAIQEIWPN